ncbi:hypothetical protein BLNAU_23281 [Blattamonas nauphoetae]|uniref:Inositol polyphosphate-related phosphatase domain-containing protein n=1 Tax=Blattamonas nauphoetae TaxID=2049346 RepID=A0ABQ9WQM4_9EUKA|nr:hypothetical protein BLNAU_23281 [Blattamonas nauphoetae]
MNQGRFSINEFQALSEPPDPLSLCAFTWNVNNSHPPDSYSLLTFIDRIALLVEKKEEERCQAKSPTPLSLPQNPFTVHKMNKLQPEQENTPQHQSPHTTSISPPILPIPLPSLPPPHMFFFGFQEVDLTAGGLLKQDTGKSALWRDSLGKVLNMYYSSRAYTSRLQETVKKSQTKLDEWRDYHSRNVKSDFTAELDGAQHSPSNTKTHQAPGDAPSALSVQQSIWSIQSFIDKLSKTPEPPFVCIQDKQYVGVASILFVRRELLPFFVSIESKVVGTGFMKTMGNKGGIGISLQIEWKAPTRHDSGTTSSVKTGAQGGEKPRRVLKLRSNPLLTKKALDQHSFKRISLCLLNAHLAAGSKQFKRRLEDYTQILKGMLFTPKTHSQLDPSPSSAHSTKSPKHLQSLFTPSSPLVQTQMSSSTVRQRSGTEVVRGSMRKTFHAQQALSTAVDLHPIPSFKPHQTTTPPSKDDHHTVTQRQKSSSFFVSPKASLDHPSRTASLIVDSLNTPLTPLPPAPISEEDFVLTQTLPPSTSPQPLDASPAQHANEAEHGLKIYDHDLVVFIGDLNFRVDAPMENVHGAIHAFNRSRKEKWEQNQRQRFLEEKMKELESMRADYERMEAEQTKQKEEQRQMEEEDRLAESIRNPPKPKPKTLRIGRTTSHSAHPSKHTASAATDTKREGEENSHHAEDAERLVEEENEDELPPVPSDSEMEDCEEERRKSTERNDDAGTAEEMGVHAGGHTISEETASDEIVTKTEEASEDHHHQANHLVARHPPLPLPPPSVADAETSSKDGEDSCISTQELLKQKPLFVSPYDVNQRRATIAKTMQQSVNIHQTDRPPHLAQPLQYLLAHDQLLGEWKRLREEREKGVCTVEAEEKEKSDSAVPPFLGLHEGPITFLPSYKLLKGTNKYYKNDEKPRVPSWCDRILWTTGKEMAELEKKERTLRDERLAKEEKRRVEEEKRKEEEERNRKAEEKTEEERKRKKREEEEERRKEERKRKDEDEKQKRENERKRKDEERRKREEDELQKKEEESKRQAPVPPPPLAESAEPLELVEGEDVNENDIASTVSQTIGEDMASRLVGSNIDTCPVNEQSAKLEKEEHNKNIAEQHADPVLDEPAAEEEGEGDLEKTVNDIHAQRHPTDSSSALNGEAREDSDENRKTDDSTPSAEGVQPSCEPANAHADACGGHIGSRTEQVETKEKPKTDDSTPSAEEVQPHCERVNSHTMDTDQLLFSPPTNEREEQHVTTEQAIVDTLPPLHSSPLPPQTPPHTTHPPTASSLPCPVSDQSSLSTLPPSTFSPSTSQDSDHTPKGPAIEQLFYHSFDFSFISDHFPVFSLFSVTLDPSEVERRAEMWKSRREMETSESCEIIVRDLSELVFSQTVRERRLEDIERKKSVNKSKGHPPHSVSTDAESHSVDERGEEKLGENKKLPPVAPPSILTS